MIVIGRPKEEQGMELEKCIEYLNRRFLPKENVANDAKIEIVNTDTENIENIENHGSGQEKVEQVSLVGIGMGTADTLTQEGKQALECADLLIGAARMVEHIRKPGQEVWTGYKPEEICAYIAAHPEHRNVAIALSGDVGFYSGAKKLLETLHRELPMVQKKVYCGISSMIYFCAKLETPWEDVHPVSLHGRECNLPGLLRIYGKLFAIVGTTDGIAKLCQKLQRYGMGDVRVEVGERLSYPEEKITRGYAWQLTELETDSLSVVLFTREGKEAIVTHGIPDEAFIRGKVPDDERGSARHLPVKITADTEFDCLRCGSRNRFCIRRDGYAGGRRPGICDREKTGGCGTVI